MALPNGFTEILPPNWYRDRLGSVFRLNPNAPDAPVFVRAVLVPKGLLGYLGMRDPKLAFPRHVLYGGPTTRSEFARWERVVTDWAWSYADARSEGQGYFVFAEPVPIAPETPLARWPTRVFGWYWATEAAPPPRFLLVERRGQSGTRVARTRVA